MITQYGAPKYRCTCDEDISHYCERECYKCAYAIDTQREKIIELLTQIANSLKHIAENNK